MCSTISTGSTSFYRRLTVTLIFILTNIIAWYLSNVDLQEGDLTINPPLSFLSEHHDLESGVGMVTTDGLWEDDPEKRRQYDIKILGFTDFNYLPVSRYWYERLTALGYTEHYLVAHDEGTYKALHANNIRVFPCFIKNANYDQKVMDVWQRVMSARLHFTMELLQNGTHLLITDVDNIFSRYVPLYGFLEEGYDVYHAYEMRYPVGLYEYFGYVLCSGHQFLRASPETLNYMDLVMTRCYGPKCDDQIIINHAILDDSEIEWDNFDTPNHTEALRVKATNLELPNERENSNLLVESMTGRSPVTNHTVKIWDRDFAWRLAGGIPEHCPSINNWVGMPTKLDNKMVGHGQNVYRKIAAFHAWDVYCLNMRHAEASNLTYSGQSNYEIADGFRKYG
mmetsp:Transcript_34712/g.83896  ORF Transcript_34712/g.83896 Transcript_34712/m.83896 type:complete len:395 (-) Transcript_34712:655-1839(-)